MGAVAAVLALFATSKKKRNISISSGTTSADSNILTSTRNVVGGHSLAASGNNITQNVVLHQHVPEGETSAQKISETRKPSRPNCHEILEALNTATPYDRPRIAKNYEGLPFSSWARFFNIWKYFSDDPDEDRYVVSLSVLAEVSDGEPVSVVPCSLHVILSLTSNPHLRIAKCGDLCWVEGKVSKVESNWIQLDSAFLTFQQQ